jgi:hypothetical protein
VAYFYFDFQDQGSQTPTEVLSSILRQLVEAKGSLETPQAVLDAYTRSWQSKMPLSVQDLLQLISDVSVASRATYIVLDALDELDGHKHRRPFLQALRELREINNVRIFVTCRPHFREIETLLDPCLHVTIEAREGDLRTHLFQQLDKGEMSDIVDEDFGNRIIETLVSKAHGM